MQGRVDLSDACIALCFSQLWESATWVSAEMHGFSSHEHWRCCVTGTVLLSVSCGVPLCFHFWRTYLWAVFKDITKVLWESKKWTFLPLNNGKGELLWDCSSSLAKNSGVPVKASGWTWDDLYFTSETMNSGIILASPVALVFTSEGQLCMLIWCLRTLMSTALARAEVAMAPLGCALPALLVLCWG